MYVMSGLFLVHVNNNEVGTRLFLKGLIWPRKQDIRFLGQKSLTALKCFRTKRNTFTKKCIWLQKLLFKAFLRTAKMKMDFSATFLQFQTIYYIKYYKRQLEKSSLKIPFSYLQFRKKAWKSNFMEPNTFLVE